MSSVSLRAGRKSAIERKSFEFDLKAPPDSSSGEFEGYAAVFNNVDRQNDVIEPGAFKKTLQENPQVPILWQHDPEEPIGVSLSMSEDEKGLRVRGKLALGVQRAAETRELMTLGAIKGLSIGYAAVRPTYERGVRHLKEIRLIEWSPVTFPANPLAAVDVVKGRSKSLGYYEDELDCLLTIVDAGGAFMEFEQGEGETDDVGAMQGVLAAVLALLGSEIAEEATEAPDVALEALSARLTQTLMTKEGRVLSGASRSLIEQAMEALQALLDAGTPDGKSSTSLFRRGAADFLSTPSGHRHLEELISLTKGS